jgi:hypothetical protein
MGNLMTTSSRCTETDIDAGRCQLRAEHEGIHANAGADAFFTWFLGDLYAWSKFRPPYWIYGLAWSDTLRPIYRTEQAS